MEESVKKYIYSLLTSSPLTTTIYQLEKDYKNTIGGCIPYHKLGYNSLEHFLRSVPDIAVVRGSGIHAEVLPATVNHEKSAHVNELVTRQRVTTKKKPMSFSIPRKNTPTSKRIIHYPPPSSSTRFKTQPSKSNTPVYKSPENTQPSNSNISPYKPPENTRTSNSIISPYKPPEKAQECITEKVPNKTYIEPNKNNTTTTTVPVINNVNANKSIANNLLELNKRHATIQYVPPKDEHSQKKMEISRTHQDYKSNVTKNTWQKTHDKPKLPLEQSEKYVPHIIKNNLKVLISRFPEGIWCAEVPSTYRKMFKQDLKYHELGFRSLIDLCSSLTTVFHYCRPSTEDFKLYDRSRPLPDCVEKNFTMASYGVEESSENSNALPTIDWLDVMSFLPDGVFEPGNEIPRTFVPETTKTDDCFDIRAGEIYDLSKFWVYIDDGKLDQLMDDLQTFYRAHASEYLMPENLIREGIYCVQLIFGEYHRALIVDVMPEVEGNIRVVFIDYGTTAKVKTKGLCYLHSDFAQLPAQAIRCRLFNILPPVECMPWTREASMCFRQSITGKDLVMRIARVNWEDKYLEIYLADVTNPDNIYYINEFLVEKGYAIYSDQEQSKSLSLHSAIVKYIHLFPTFLELEYGFAPSLQEMEVLYDLNIPINFAYPQYFNVDFSSEEVNIKEIEDFYEIHCLSQKRDVNMHFYDLSQFTPKSFDLSILGELQFDIKEFMEGNNIDENEESSAQHEKEKKISCDDEILKCVTEIKKDCILAEDIVRDLEQIYNVGSFNNQRQLSISEEKSINSNFILNDFGQDSDYRDFLNMSQTDDTDNVHEEFDHPLSKMTFDVDSSSPVSTNSSSFKDAVEEAETTEYQDLSTSYYHEIEDELKEVEDKMCSITLQDVKENFPVSTNPFLADISDDSNEDLQVAIKNTNNPFLNFLDESNEDSIDCSDASSGSTVYETYTEKIKVKQTWSTCDSSPADKVSHIEAMSCYSNSSLDSQKISSLPGQAITSHTSEDDVKSFVSLPNNFQHPISAPYPASVPPQMGVPPNPYMAGEYYHNNWMMNNYGNQYHYSHPPFMGYNNYRPQQYDPQYMHNQYRYGHYPPPYQQTGYQPRPPLIRPPPGFGHGPNVPMHRPPNTNFPMFTGASLQVQQTVLRASTSESADFYEMYNQRLRAKLKSEEDK